MHGDCGLRFHDLMTAGSGCLALTQSWLPPADYRVFSMLTALALVKASFLSGVSHVSTFSPYFRTFGGR
jgi:hypothetical protein